MKATKQKKADRTRLLTKKEAKSLSRAFHKYDMGICTMAQWLERITEDFPQLTKRAKSAKSMLIYARYTCADEFRKLFFAAEGYRGHEEFINKQTKENRKHEKSLKEDHFTGDFKETIKGWVKEGERDIEEAGEKMKAIIKDMIGTGDETMEQF